MEMNGGFWGLREMCHGFGAGWCGCILFCEFYFLDEFADGCERILGMGFAFFWGRWLYGLRGVGIFFEGYARLGFGLNNYVFNLCYFQ